MFDGVSSIPEALHRERRGLEATPTDSEVRERLNRLKGMSQWLSL
jgi:hypothetical protein